MKPSVGRPGGTINMRENIDGGPKRRPLQRNRVPVDEEERAGSSS
jgi:hypothetical protein